MTYDGSLTEFAPKDVDLGDRLLDIDDDQILRRVWNHGWANGLQIALSGNVRDGSIRFLQVELKLKFGPLSAASEEKLQTASDKQLESWSRKMIFAHTVEDALS